MLYILDHLHSKYMKLVVPSIASAEYSSSIDILIGKGVSGFYNMHGLSK
jgi:hypothetical protein